MEMSIHHLSAIASAQSAKPNHIHQMPHLWLMERDGGQGRRKG